jgi:hypothetical protein
VSIAFLEFSEFERKCIVLFLNYKESISFARNPLLEIKLEMCYDNLV